MATGFWPRIYAAGATLAVLALAFLVIVAWSYEGECGGFLFFSAPYPCSFGQYMSFPLKLLGVLLFVFWPVVLALLFLPALITYFLDRRRQSSPSKVK